MPLIDLISVIPPEGDEETEDIFAAAPGLIFPDDTMCLHGDEASTLVYHSSRFGDIRLKVADFNGESERRLFAHYLWNAGVGLVSIIACLAGAEHVVCSDYPSRPLLENLQRNLKGAIPPELHPNYSVEGYQWGDLTSPFATKHAHHFTRIVAADCFWMPHEHQNLVASMLHLLSHECEARILVVGGFHTGRSKLAEFFDEAVSQGLELEEIYEVDVDGVRRRWAKERDQGRENPTELKRWLVIAVLRRHQDRGNLISALETSRD